jgi:competence protein ComEA
MNEEASPSWVDEARAAISPAGWRRLLASIPTLKPREIVALTVLVVAILSGAAFAFVRAMPRSAEGPAVAPIAEPSASASPAVVVYVAGAVRAPGVYDFASGARVIDALQKAGGLRPDAEVDQLNLAAPLSDGSKLYVPRRGEQQAAGGGGATSSASSDGKVNINTASAAELDARVPGVGPVLAQRIVDYRTQHGPFRSINDLLKVEGIGQKKFDSLKASVTV